MWLAKLGNEENLDAVIFESEPTIEKARDSDTYFEDYVSLNKIFLDLPWDVFASLFGTILLELGEKVEVELKLEVL